VGHAKESADVDGYGSLSFLVRRTWLSMRAAIGEALREHGLTTPQYATLGIAATNPGCSNSDVARWVGSTRQSANEMLAALERDGLITRGPHPSDRRTQQIHLTPLGERRLTEAGTAVARREAELEAAFSPAERRTVRAWMTGVARACDDLDGC
jgi:DNA-binding MarR family transcriptional regulator